MAAAVLHHTSVGAGPDVVLVHGLSGSARWWQRNVAGLSAEFRVHLVDLLGFGASRRLGRFSLHQASQSLAAWMDGTGVEHAAVMGHSMGGLVAAELAADWPERVERLVLVAAPVLPLDRSYTRQVRGVARGVLRLPPRFWPVLAADAWRAGPRTILRAALELRAADVRDRLTLIRAPTLLVWGGRDAIVPVSVGRELQARLADARLVVLPPAGHNPMWERPAEFNRLVRDFLAGESDGHLLHGSSTPGRRG